MTNKEIFEKYAELKQAEKELKAEMDELNPQVLEAMGDNEEVETDWGKFTLASRRSWLYPEAINRAEDDLKIAKKTAEQTGDASYVENSYLRFTGVKG